MTESEKQIQNLLKAVIGMEKTQEFIMKTQEKTTQTVDKLADNVSKISDVDTKFKVANNRIADLESENEKGIRPQTLKHMLIYAGISIVGFGTYITLYTFSIDKELSTHEAEYKSEVKQMNEKITDNKNQITYLKGVKQDKPKG